MNQENASVDDDDDFDIKIMEASDLLSKLEQRAVSKSGESSAANCSKTLKTATDLDFNFPFTPYLIQSDFMVQLYNTVEAGNVGIFESPTGTGKSLSLICGSLTWLRMNNERIRTKFNALLQKQASADCDDDWIQAFATKEDIVSKNREFLEWYKRLQQRELDLLNQRKKDIKSSSAFGSKCYKRNLTAAGKKSDDELSDTNDPKETDDEEGHLIPEEYHSDGETGAFASTNTNDGGDDAAADAPKIIYCSRTHSQLSQVLNEIKKTSFAKEIRVVTLGSRQTFCVNEVVRKLNQINLINDRCLQLQKDKSSDSSKKRKLEVSTTLRSKKGCPYQKRTAVDELSNTILINGIQDVENLISDGRRLKSCPYYASRRAIAAAHVVLAPYQILLHKATRESYQLNIRDNVLIIDEAHNLLDTISSIHSVDVTILQLESAQLQLQRYLERFSARLTAKNLMYIRQFGMILENFISCLKRTGQETVMNLNDFVFFAGIETVNLFKLLRYIETTRICEKLNAYVNRSLADSTINDVESERNVNSQTTFSPFHAVQAFLSSLLQRSDDGRIVLIPNRLQNVGIPTPTQKNQGKLKFIHLNPAIFFKDLFTEARSVVLAGGTMEPVTDLVELLITPCGISSTSVDRFSCGHVIDDENLLPLILDKGPSNVGFDFTFSNRNDESLIRDLGRLLTNLIHVAPGGIICFFQSYEYEATVHKRWSDSGILRAIEKKKRIFREPARSSEVNAVLENYSRHASSGALMLAVVGGKLSEGINFADDLGRLVVMVGLPFPNFNSVELKEKMRVLCSRSCDNHRGQDYYENLCMKAVNQSIGRVIRHRDDYAAILLLDKGYAKPGIQKKLAPWIRKLIKQKETFGTCFGHMKEFFRNMEVKYPKDLKH